MFIGVVPLHYKPLEIRGSYQVQDIRQIRFPLLLSKVTDHTQV